VPIYEYRCDNSHEFDVFQRMSDDALTECQVCGAPARRVLSAPAVHFKGSGFYTTDYGKKKAADSSTDTKPKKSESSSGSSSSSSSNGSSSDD
jgi:putative FmdB family regulatory protein